MDLALSYDDVLIVPKRSSIKSRKDVSTETFLTKNIKLKLPIISSNMDTVTEADMAICMAQLGGIGIIHRFNTIEQQVEEVKKVKRYRNAIIEKPLTICPEASLEEAKKYMKNHGVTSILVVEDDKLIGILTRRDYRFNPPKNTLVKDLMTSKEKLVVANTQITIEEAKKIMLKHKIEKLPIIDAHWTLMGLITGKDIYNKTKFPDATVDKKDRLMVGAAIGVKQDSIKRTDALIKAGVDIIVIDIAHGHSDLAINMLKKVKKKFPTIPVIAGNVATPSGVKDLIDAGADCVKVGVGPGSACTTRIVTGSGYPQLSAIIKCAEEADKYNIPIIADGGIRFPGDITKAIGAGASTVMLGSLLAGTDESPGFPLIKNGKKFKVYRGMASYGARLGRDAKENNDNNNGNEVLDYTPEGVEALVPYRGSVTEVIKPLLGGLRSGMSYCGATCIHELRGKAEFVRITQAGVRESHPHDINQL